MQHLKLCQCYEHSKFTIESVYKTGERSHWKNCTYGKKKKKKEKKPNKTKPDKNIRISTAGREICEPPSGRSSGTAWENILVIPKHLISNVRDRYKIRGNSFPSCQATLRSGTEINACPSSSPCEEAADSGNRNKQRLRRPKSSSDDKWRCPAKVIMS